MTTPTNYIATWFYKESKEDASFYPQAGKRGDSALVHSIYMQIQVPFFTTFRHYHPDDKLLFFSNLDQFPDYLERLFKELRIETVTLPYLCIIKTFIINPPCFPQENPSLSSEERICPP